jgi:hypothetical protein
MFTMTINERQRRLLLRALDVLIEMDTDDRGFDLGEILNMRDDIYFSAHYTRLAPPAAD